MKTLTALVLCLCITTAQADQFDDAYAAYKKGDYATTLRLLRPLAETGDASAQYSLGNMYANGQGVPQDYVEAHKWYNLSASRLTDEEDRNLATKNRDSVAAEMTPAQVAEAQKLARECVKKNYKGC